MHAGDEAAAAGASGRLPEVVPFIPQGVLQTEVARLRGHFGPPVKWLHFVLHELETPSAAMKPWEGRPRTFSVLPQCGLRTPFITIDSEVLREIAGVVVDGGGCPFWDPGKVRVRAPPPAPCAPRARPPARPLADDRCCMRSCMQREAQEPLVSRKARAERDALWEATLLIRKVRRPRSYVFAHQVKTDGVSASVLFIRPQKVPALVAGAPAPAGRGRRGRAPRGGARPIPRPVLAALIGGGRSAHRG